MQVEGTSENELLSIDGGVTAKHLTEVKAGHSENALMSIEVTPLPMVTEVKFLHQ